MTSLSPYLIVLLLKVLQLALSVRAKTQTNSNSKPTASSAKSAPKKCYDHVSLIEKPCPKNEWKLGVDIAAVVVGLALLAGWVYWYKRKHTSKNKGPGGAAHACEPLTQEESHEEHMHKYLDERV